jgi:integrase
MSVLGAYSQHPSARQLYGGKRSAVPRAFAAKFVPPDTSSHQELSTRRFYPGDHERGHLGIESYGGTKAGGRTKKADPKDPGLQRRKIQATHAHAYTLEEVAEMLDKLPRTHPRTVIAVAGFTGLTRSELRGLKWGTATARRLPSGEAPG